MSIENTPEGQKRRADWLKQMTDTYGAGNFAVPMLAGGGGGSPIGGSVAPSTYGPIGGGLAGGGGGGGSMYYDLLKQYGTPPTAPSSSGSIQGTTLDANLAAGPKLADIMNLINTINLNAQKAANEARIPGAAGLERQSSQNIDSALGGQLPADVIRQLQDQAAERGLATGSPGSPNANAAYLRALGLNSLQLQNQGQQWLTSAYGRNPVAPVADPSQFLLTPAQQGQLNLGTGYLNLAQNHALGITPGVTFRNMSSMGPVLGPTSEPDNSWFGNLFSSAGTPGPAAFPYAANPYATATTSNTADYGDEVDELLGEGNYAVPGDGYYPDNPFTGFEQPPEDDLSQFGM